MPHLRYAGRLWHVAGDDLSIPALCSITGRIVWTVLICVLYGFTSKYFHSCSTGWVFDLYFSISIFFFILSIINDGSLIRISLKGTMTSMEERKNIGKNLTVKFILIMFQIACAIFGLISIIVDTSFPCSDDVNQSQITRVFILIVCISQIVDASFLFCCCYCLQKREDITERIDYENNYENLNENLMNQSSSIFESSVLSSDQIVSDTSNETWTIDIWENKCKKITRIISLVSCGLFGGKNIDDGFEEVAKVLTLFFHYDGFLDVVPSDVIAGITLVRIQQRALKDTFKLKLAKNKSFENGRVSLKLIDNPNRDNTNTDFYNSGDSASNSYYKSNVDDLDFADQIDANNIPEEVISPSSPTSFISGGDIEAGFGPKANTGFDLSAGEFDNWLRCSVYSLAMYTHFMVIFMNPCTGLCNLCMNGVVKDCCNCTNYYNTFRNSSRANTLSKQVLIEGDNLCGFNNAGLNIIKRYLDNTDLIYVSFKNDTTNKPYAIFLDHDKKWLVISIRGTLSLEDCITDAICEPVELKEAGDMYGFNGENRWAHGGMLHGALHIRKELDRTGILKRILGDNKFPHQNQPNIDSNSVCYSHYSLIVTGHSLGAGTAIILSLLLHSEYPNVRCYSLGTPASVLDGRTSREVNSYISSLVLGNDLVCRLNFGALCELRHNILDAISRAKVNKMKILRSVIFNDYIDPDEYLYPAQQEPNTMFKKSVNTFSSVINKRLEVYSGKELRIPGYIVHLTKRNHIDSSIDKYNYSKNTSISTLHDSSHKNNFSFFKYNLFRSKKDSNDSEDFRDSYSFYLEGDYVPIERNLDDFLHIVVSTSMTVDHLPDHYFYEIKKIRDRLFQREKK